MKDLDRIIEICKNFKEKKFDLLEFQSRLQTLIIEDEFKQYLSNLLYDVDNRLEEIRFCSLEENFYKYGVEVADSLMEKVAISQIVLVERKK